MSSSVLVLNAGSSSLKFALFDMQQHSLLLEGIAERLGADNAEMKITDVDVGGGESSSVKKAGLDHLGAIKILIAAIAHYPKPIAVGHRVVHGGEFFRDAVRVDKTVMKQIEQCTELAPLHNPANLLGIQAATKQFKDVPQVAVFDTAFHNSIPKHAFLYALPMSLYRDQSIRRYGFHGTSHQYVSIKTADYMQKPVEDVNMVVAHLGNGCSATAVAGGKSVDTTMGMTPLEGLVMGTRSGSLDPAILLYLAEHKSMSLKEIDQLLNKESGLLGLSELTNDMRELEEAKNAGHEGAIIAIDVFCYRLAKSIAGLAISLPSFDALAFTGGIGENSAYIRERTTDLLKVLGVVLDADKNNLLARKMAGKVSALGSKTEIWVVPTNEELMIAQQAFKKSK